MISSLIPLASNDLLSTAPVGRAEPFELGDYTARPRPDHSIIATSCRARRDPRREAIGYALTRFQIAAVDNDRHQPPRIQLRYRQVLDDIQADSRSAAWRLYAARARRRPYEAKQVQ